MPRCHCSRWCEAWHCLSWHWAHQVYLIGFHLVPLVIEYSKSMSRMFCFIVSFRCPATPDVSLKESPRLLHLYNFLLIPTVEKRYKRFCTCQILLLGIILIYIILFHILDRFDPIYSFHSFTIIDNCHIHTLYLVPRDTIRTTPTNLWNCTQNNQNSNHSFSFLCCCCEKIMEKAAECILFTVRLIVLLCHCFSGHSESEGDCSCRLWNTSSTGEQRQSATFGQCRSMSWIYLLLLRPVLHAACLVDIFL